MKSKIKSTSPKVSLDELFKVLSFYADKDHYDWDMCGGFNKPKTAVDCGSKARKILKKLVKETLNKEGIRNNL